MTKNIQSSFTIDIKELKRNLTAISRLTGKFTKTTFIQIRVLNTAIEISLKGIVKRIEVSTNGEADITLPVSLLKSFLTDSSDYYKTFIFRNGEIGCGASIFSTHSIKVEPVFTNFENVLPNNLTKISILKYWLINTEDENERIGLTATIKLAKNRLNTDIQEALYFLNQYNVAYEDLEELVKKKINNLA